RAEILFKKYPRLEQAYNLAQNLGHIYSIKEKGVAFTKLAQWYNRVEELGFKQFNTISRTIQSHYQTILNYFDKRSTNAAAELAVRNPSMQRSKLSEPNLEALEMSASFYIDSLKSMLSTISPQLYCLIQNTSLRT
ncbi:MAG: transposase, partial [Cyclobacteriaceae bacterium]